jgi:hypothetical protein
LREPSIITSDPSDIYASLLVNTFERLDSIRLTSALALQKGLGPADTLTWWKTPNEGLLGLTPVDAVGGDPPSWNEVPKQSGTVAYSENSSLALYLNECEAGRSDVQYSNGGTYFVFSGIKDNNCVFYIHTLSAAATTWDGLIRTRCVWDINSGNDNTPIFNAGPNGIEFGDFLKKNCNPI